MIRTMTVNDVLNFIDDNLESELNIDIIVKYSGYGRRYIQILFNRYMNFSLGKYIRIRRITRAALLLRLTQAPIIDIALRLHFDSQQSFTRAFRKIVGCSPLQYRKGQEWDLSSLNAYREVGAPPPSPPDISQIDSNCIYGFQFIYDEIIPFERFSDHRWRHLKQQYDLLNQELCCLTEVAGKKTSDIMTIKTAIGINNKKQNKLQNEFFYKGGLHAHFHFSGEKDDYVRFTNSIYLKTLPFYKIIRRKGPDIEMLTLDNNIIESDYYIPIKK